MLLHTFVQALKSAEYDKYNKYAQKSQIHLFSIGAYDLLFNVICKIINSIDGEQI